MKNQRDQHITSYLKELRASLTYGRCAGKITELTKLHQNRLINEDYRIFQFMKFRDMCRVIGSANLHSNRKPVNPGLEEIFSIINDFEIDGYTEDEMDEILHPYWYAKYFNLKLNQFHYYGSEDRNLESTEDIIMPNISQKQRLTANEFLDQFFQHGFSALLNLENLQIIQQAASEIRQSMENMLTDLDSQKNQELLEIQMDLDTHITETSNQHELDLATFDEYRKFIENVPKAISFAEGEKKIFEKKEAMLVARITSSKEQLNRLQRDRKNNIERMNEFKKRMISQVSSQHKEFLEMMPTSKTSLFGDIPNFINSIILGEQTLPNELEDLGEGGLISVYGDPGFGKTIQLRQFTHRLTSSLLSQKSNLKIPIFVKAKALSRYIRVYEQQKVGLKVEEERLRRRARVGSQKKETPFNPFAPNAAELRQKRRNHREPFNPFEHILTKARKQAAVERQELEISDPVADLFKQAILHTESDIEEEVVKKLFNSVNIEWNEIYLVIDAYDEILSEEERGNLISFICEKITQNKCRIIITCRNSHKNEIVSKLEKDYGALAHKMMKIHFTKEELQYTMPTKLANAWGLDSDQISHSAAIQFKQYEEVLTHPLFVGFFCMLLSHDALSSTDEANPFFQKTESEKQPIQLEGSISLQHVVFLKKVIKFGLEINIEEREGVNESEVDRIRKIFCYIAATSLTTGLSNLNNILRFITKYHNLEISEKEKKILNENLGVMFVNGEKEIEWTHKTLPEIATGLLILEDEEYKNYLTEEYGSIFGTYGRLWSECLLMTLIQEDLENFDSGEDFEILKGLFPSMGRVPLERTLNMFGVEGRRIAFITYLPDKGTYKYSIDGSPMVVPLVKALAASYFKHLKVRKSFPIPNSLIQEHMSKEFLIHIFTQTNIEQGIYSDIVTIPELLSFPNISIDEIFERLEHDIYQLSTFYFDRKVKDICTKVHPSPKKEREFVSKLITAINDKPSTYSMKDYADRDDWPEILLNSLWEKNSLDLLNAICKNIKNKHSLLNISQIDDDSLYQLNDDLLDKIHHKETKKRKDSFPFRSKIKAHFLRDFYPDIFKQLIGVILSRKLWEPLPLEMENLQETWGLGLNDKCDDFGAVFNLDEQDRMNDSFDKIPSWIPKSDIVNNWGDEREGDL